MRRAFLVLAGFLHAAPTVNAVAPPPPTTVAVHRGLARLRQGATRYTENRQCFSCHHQAITLAAFHAATRAHIPLDAAFVEKQRIFTLETFRNKLDRVRKGQAVGGGNTMAVYALFALEQSGHPGDATTTALIEYLIKRQLPDGSWPALTQRPPTEGSPFTNAALALRALRHYGQKAGDDLKERAESAARKGKGWLLSHDPLATEDRVFHLLGLHTAKAERSGIIAAQAALVRLQNSDGSWSQLEKRPGDAYATATVLVALRTTKIDGQDAAYRRGIAYLLRTQNRDGSWMVKTRSKPVQTFFDNGDPGGKSQFISFHATGWATLALLGGGIE